MCSHPLKTRTRQICASQGHTALRSARQFPHPRRKALCVFNNLQISRRKLTAANRHFSSPNIFKDLASVYGKQMRCSRQISARSLLWLRRGRQDSVQAQVHGGGCVMIGPAARESEGAHGAGELASAEKFDVVAEL